MEQEIWKDIEGYEGLYQVSNFGIVKSLDRTVTRSSHSMILKSYILKLWYDKKQYQYVSICKLSVKKHQPIHRLVAKHFIPNPLNLPCVCHKDDNPKNNHATNLWWGTQQDNIKDMMSKKRNSFGERSGLSKLKESDVLAIRELRNNKKIPIIEISKLFNMSTNSISRISRYVDWKHIA